MLGTSGINYCYSKINDDHKETFEAIWEDELKSRMNRMSWDDRVKIPTACYYAQNDGN